jgi:hypothetical protein
MKLKLRESKPRITTVKKYCNKWDEKLCGEDTIDISCVRGWYESFFNEPYQSYCCSKRKMKVVWERKDLLTMMKRVIKENV